MSKISDVITALYSLITTNLSDYNELPDPYDIEGNTELFLKKGFAISVNAGTNDQDRSVSCHRWTTRTFTFTLTNKITTTRENKDSMKTLQKSIMEDQETINQALYDDRTIGDVAQDAIYISDNGIEYLTIDEVKYFRLDTTIEVTYIKQV